MSKKTILLNNSLKKKIHINKHVINSNNKTGERKPVVTIKCNKTNIYGHEVIIYDNKENEIARVVYRPDKPLNCGAVVWIETKQKVEVINNAY